MGEVEPQVICAYKGTFLLYMSSEHFPKSLVHKVGGGVVCGNLGTAPGVHLEYKFTFTVLRDAVCDMYGEVVLLDGVEDFDLFA